MHPKTSRESAIMLFNPPSPKVRATILAIVGLGLIYKVANHRGLIPSIGQLMALRQPITCPADETLHNPPTTFVNGDKGLAKVLPANFDDPRSVGDHRTKITILIEKSQHRLTLYYNQQPVKSYGVVFGNGKGDKRQEGDRKTPEGILKIQDKYPHPDWSKFLWLDYPNAQSACKHNRAKQQGEIPWNSTIGGEVGIHGVPIGSDNLIDDQQNWTWGCPSLKTADINELYEVVQPGTIVEIVA
jgi:lipoprotein-anchoring transpeptidase ErfK/SrfK